MEETESTEGIVSEMPAEVAPEETHPAAPEPRISSQFAALTRKQKAIARADAEHRQRAEKLAAREADLARYDDMDPFDAIAERARSRGQDPIEALRKAAEKLVESGAPVDPIRQELEQLKAWRTEREQYEQQHAERQQAQEAERVRNSYIGDALKAAESHQYAGALDQSELTEAILVESRRVLAEFAERGGDPNAVDSVELRDYVLTSINAREQKRYERLASRLTAQERAPSRAPAIAERAAPSRGGLSRAAASELSTPTNSNETLSAAYALERQLFRRNG